MTHISNTSGSTMKAICILFCFAWSYLPAQVVEQQSGQVYLSIDGGENWRNAGVGLPAGVAINAWVVKGNRIIAGTDSHGIYISDNRIQSWYMTGKGMPKNVRITTLTVHQGLLFAGTYRHGIYLSEDEGETWKPLNKGLVNLTIRDLHTTGSILLVGTNDGIYTLNGSDLSSWVQKKRGFQVNAFASSNNRIFVATNHGVLASGDLGNTWEEIFSTGAIYTLNTDNKDIYLMDFFGVVYRSRLQDIVWLRADVYLPFRYTFQLTQSGRKFFTADWVHSFKYLERTNTVSHFKGLPDELPVTELLNTPFGLLAAALPEKRAKEKLTEGSCFLYVLPAGVADGDALRNFNENKKPTTKTLWASKLHPSKTDRLTGSTTKFPLVDLIFPG